MHLRRAILFAKDLERMTRFYRDAFGLRVRADSVTDTWAELESAGGAQLALHAIPAAIARTIHITNPPAPREETPIKLVFEAEDLAAARAHLITHGAKMNEVTAWGTCDGVDPEGNVFQIMRREQQRSASERAGPDA